MKKILSFALIFVLSLTVYSTMDIKAEATGDVTVTFHIHQFDGEYTNTGIGVWDGVDWNSFSDVQTSTDEFGAVIVKTWTADKVNDANFLDSIEIKPSSNGDNADNYLAPASVEGKVFLDVTKLKDGTKTNLDVYYVEGAKDFYVSTAGNGLFMNVFANAEVAADPTVYDGWGMHTWANGSGASGPTWDEPVPYEIEMEIQVGEFLVPMRLGVLEVGAGATANAGFIAHKGDEKAWDSDMFFDAAALIDEAGNKAQVVLYEKGKGEFTADYATFLTNVENSWKENLKNKFIGAVISTPETMDLTMLSPKSPFDLDITRFNVTDSLGNNVAIDGLTLNTTPEFHAIDSDIEVSFQNYFRVFVKTDYPAADIVMAGNFQGWNPSAGIAPVGEYMGYKVFEVATSEASIEYLFLYNDPTQVDDPETEDIDESGFDWGDMKFSGENNLVIDFSETDTYVGMFFDEDDRVIEGTYEFTTVDKADYTYSTTAVCGAEEKLFTLFVNTEELTTDLGMVGSVQTPNEWTPGEAIAPIGETDGGLAVFEVCMAADEKEYKILVDGEDDAFAWGDLELNTANQPLVFGEETEVVVLLDSYTFLNAYEAQVSVTNTYRYTLYLNAGDLDVADFGIVGDLNPNGWDPSNPLMFTEMDGAGNYYIDFELNTTEAAYKVLYKGDADTFDWPQSIFGNDNSNTMIGATGFKADYISYAMIDVEVEVTDEVSGETTTETVQEMAFSKDDVTEAKTTTLSLNFADDTLMYGETYTVSYIEAFGATAEENTVITYEVNEFTVSNNFVPGDDIAETGTYALENDMLQVIFTNSVAYTADMGVQLVNSAGTVIPFDSIDPMYVPGTYANTLTCDAGHELLTVIVQTNTDGDLADYVLVGTPQQSGYDATLNEGEGGWTNGGWSPENGIPAVGRDSEGNVVFEVCVETLGMDGIADTEDDIVAHEFKVLFGDSEAGFSWSDTQLTPDNVAFTFDGSVSLFIEDGNGVGASNSYIYNLAATDALDPTDTYTLVYTDENGFVIELEVIIDESAPEIDFAGNGTEFEINNDATEFDLTDYFNVLRFLDNRDGEVDYVITTTVDLAVNGEQTVTLTATDSWGNVGTHTFTFTVIDVIAPTLTVQENVSFDAGSEAPDWNDYVTVEGGTVTFSDAQVDMANAGKFFITYTATDEAGNTTSETMEVTINALAVEDPSDVVDKVEDTGCFGSIGVGSVFAIVLTIVGGAAIVVIRKQQ